MNKKLVVSVIAGVIIISLAAALVSGPKDITAKQNGEAIGVIVIEGVISGTQSEAGLLGGAAGSPAIIEQLKKAREDRSIKAVLIRINSPGGSAAASDEIGKEIEKIRHEGKKVVVSMGDVAASGGYWIAAKADRIIASPATITGSIGVIMESANMEELFNKLGISPQVIKSGPHKDMGSANRSLTTEEREILQSMVDDIYNQFVDVVATGRKMDRDKVIKLADGRIYTGRQAKALGLVDELGNYYDAVSYTAKLAGIKGEPELRELGPVSPFDMFLTRAGALLGLRDLYSGLSGLEFLRQTEILKSEGIKYYHGGF